MKALTLEVRDRMTFLPVLAVNMNAGDHPGANQQEFIGQKYLLRRAGYACDGQPTILLTKLDGTGKATYDPHQWGDRTLQTAHVYITKKWEKLKDGDVIDVEFILGETNEPKVSERTEFGDVS